MLSFWISAALGVAAYAFWRHAQRVRRTSISALLRPDAACAERR